MHMRISMGPLCLVGLLIGGLLATPGMTDAQSATGYLARFTDQVIYLAPIVAGNSEWYVTTDNAGQVTTQSSAVTWQESGSNVELTFAQLTYGGHSTLTGTITHDLKLYIPTNQGTFEDILLVPGTVTQYNQAVTTIQQQAAHMRQQEAKVRAYQAKVQAFDALSATIQSDLAQLPHDQATVQSDIQSTRSGLNQEFHDLEITLQAEKTTQRMAQAYPNGDNGNVSYDASNVSYDASNVRWDASNVEWDQSQWNDDATAWAQEIQSLWAAIKRYTLAKRTFHSLPIRALPIPYDEALAKQSHQAFVHTTSVYAADTARRRTMVNRAKAAANAVANLGS